MIPTWLQDLAVLAVVGTAILALVRHFGLRRARACPSCGPRREPGATASAGGALGTGIRARGLTILP